MKLQRRLAGLPSVRSGPSFPVHTAAQLQYIQLSGSGDIAAAVLPVVGWEPAKAPAANISCSSKDAAEATHRIACEQYQAQIGNDPHGIVCVLGSIRTRPLSMH
ncbi:hypothetical protein [uncultured Bosea sp.]|uniref:hypothetical protein n=1 Tax=uncultured Bosea sp. TaxID=211457 RepID=UPI0025EEECB3|nr:hypothetical protein [uncultured Bosea sp.]